MIPNQDLSKYGGLEFLIESDYDPKLLNLKNLPEFYHALLTTKLEQPQNIYVSIEIDLL